MMTLHCPCGKTAILDERKHEGVFYARLQCACGRQTQWQDGSAAWIARVEAIKVWYTTRGNEGEVRG